MHYESTVTKFISSFLRRQSAVVVDKPASEARHGTNTTQLRGDYIRIPQVALNALHGMQIMQWLP